MGPGRQGAAVDVGPSAPPPIVGPNSVQASLHASDDRTNFANRKDGAKVVAANECVPIPAACSVLGNIASAKGRSASLSPSSAGEAGSAG